MSNKMSIYQYFLSYSRTQTVDLSQIFIKFQQTKIVLGGRFWMFQIEVSILTKNNRLYFRISNSDSVYAVVAGSDKPPGKFQICSSD